MPDTETLAEMRAKIPPRTGCPRCRAQEDAVPTEAQLRILATEDWDPKALAFIPRAMTQEQAVAAEMYIAAVGRFTRAFGVETAGARLSATLDSLRIQAIRIRIVGRQIEARKEISARYYDTLMEGPTPEENFDGSKPVLFEGHAYPTSFVARLEAILDEPTPDYPGKDRDDAWLAGGR